MEIVDAGTADTDSVARATATAAPFTGARRWGQEFGVAAHENAVMVIPGLGDTGETDVVELRDVLR